MAFFKQEAVEGTYGQDLGVPVVENYSLCLGDFVLWKAFHPCSDTLSATNTTFDRK
jgi:hypothetical protein